MKRLVSACMIGCLCFGMGACSSSDTKEKEEEVVKKDVYGLNESVDLEDCKYTVTAASTSEGDGGYIKPKDGKIFVVVDVTIENTSDGEISYNTLDFSMQNAQGQIDSLGFSLFTPENPLGSGKLAAGGKVSGTVVSEQDASGLDGLILIYEPSMFSSEAAKVQLSF